MPNEKISAAAIKIGNEIYTGPTHFGALRKIYEVPGLDADTVMQMVLSGEDGFVTDTGRFVTREEAFIIAQQAQQIGAASPMDLADPVKNMDFYGKPEPTLDSGMLEHYAPLRVRRSCVF